MKFRFSAASHYVARMALVIVGTLLTAKAAPLPSFEAKMDVRGYVDVWQLRAALNQVEPFVADDNTDSCSPKGDEGEDPGIPTPQQRAALQRQLAKSVAAEKACATRIQTRFANYQRIQNAFNSAWMPTLLSAAKKGDKVAEVILIRCDSTPVLPRDQYPSTCSTQPEVRQQAIQRLRQAGFPAAIPIEDELGFCEFKNCGSRSPAGLETLQGLVLKAFEQGNFSQVPYEAITQFSVDKDPKQEYRLARNKALIEAARQDVPKVFLIRSEGNRDASNFEQLNVNRATLRPGVLTWGAELLNYYDSGALSVDHKDHWRSVPFAPTLCAQQQGLLNPCLRVGFGLSGKYVSYMEFRDPDFEKDLKHILRSAEDSISKILMQDPRWGIFLLNRVGFHEWSPMGIQTNSSKLDTAWLGNWKSIESFANWDTYAEIAQENNETRMTTRTQVPKSNQLPPAWQDVSDCTLRYSGGSTPLGFGESGTQLARIGLGEAPSGFNLLDPKKRYKQVLMQCKNAESSESDAIRFLLLAGDTMFEISGNLSQRFARTVYVEVRVFKRQ